MMIRYFLLSASTIILLLIITFPMRGVVKLSEVDNIFIAQEISGFWWDAQFKNTYLVSKKLGNLNIKLDPSSLPRGQLGFDLELVGPELNLDGKVGISLFGNYAVEHLNISYKPLKKISSSQVISQTLSSFKGHIDYIYFNNSGCLNSHGEGKGELLDDFGIFTRNLALDINLRCKEQSLELRFASLRSSLLEGEIIITPNFEYNFEARSQRISRKIRELSKLNFKSEPALKVSGRLSDLIDYL